LGRARAGVNLTRSLTQHLTHGRTSTVPYAVALAWPDGPPDEGATVRLDPVPPPRRARREALPDVPPIPAPAAHEIGGKAAGLELLRGLDVAVPEFVVVDASAVERILAAEDPHTAARAAVASLGLSSGGRWAVRSSADVEDALDDPMSGVFESKIGVALEALPTSVCEVAADAQNPEVLERVRTGRLERKPRMAVVVQRMVDEPLLAGAVFVPTRREPGLGVLEGVAGRTGEALMDGSSEPDVRCAFDGDGALVEFEPPPGPPDVARRLHAACESVARGAMRIYLGTGRGDLEFAVDRDGSVWWLQARVRPVAVEEVDRRGHAPAAVAYYKLLAFRVAEANLTPPVYFRCVDLEDGRFGYTVGIRHRDAAFHRAVRDDIAHLEKVTAFGWDIEKRTAGLLAAPNCDVEELFDTLVLHGAAHLPFSIPVRDALKERFESESVDEGTGALDLEEFLAGVIESLGRETTVNQAVNLLRAPERCLSELEADTARLHVLRSGPAAGDEDVLACLVADMRDLPDLSPEGAARRRNELERELAAPDAASRLEESIAAHRRALREGARARRAFLGEAERALPDERRRRLRIWAAYLAMKGEINETHSLYRGRCFVRFAREGFAPGRAFVDERIAAWRGDAASRA